MHVKQTDMSEPLKYMSIPPPSLPPPPPSWERGVYVCVCVSVGRDGGTTYQRPPCAEVHLYYSRLQKIYKQWIIQGEEKNSEPTSSHPVILVNSSLVQNP